MMYLIEDDLGQLDIDCDDGLVMSQLEIGFPAERAVVRGRALGDGVYDDTRFVGPRIITVAVRFNDDRCVDPSRELQALIDSMLGYMSPRRRPRLVWELQTGSGDLRSAVVRGVDAPVIIEGQRYPTVVFQFATVGSFIELPTEVCFIRDPNIYVPEAGREYPLTFDRVYPPSVPTDGVAVVNPGNGPADWVATILGPAITPNVIVNGVPIRTDRAGGVVLIAGQTLVIDTRQRTVLLNNDPNESRYDRLNFEEWTWDDLLLRPGTNVFRFNGPGAWFDTATRLTVCTRGAWL